MVCLARYSGARVRTILPKTWGLRVERKQFLKCYLRRRRRKLGGVVLSKNLLEKARVQGDGEFSLAELGELDDFS